MSVRILLVEDNPGDARLIQEYARIDGEAWAELEWVRSLQDALVALATVTPDAVILDLGLPDSQGLEGYERIRSLSPSVPVVILTGLDDQEQGAEAVAAGAQDWLWKGEANGPVLRRAIQYAVERARVSKALLESEAQLRAIFENAADGILVLDSEGTVLEANPSACQMHGYSREELVGMNARTLVHPSSMGKFQEFLQATKDGRGFVGTARDLRKDGTSISLEVQGSSMTVHGERRLLALLHDVTERDRAQKALELRSSLADVFLHTADTKVYGELLDRVREWLASPTGLFGYIDAKGDLVVPALIPGFQDPATEVQEDRDPTQAQDPRHPGQPRGVQEHRDLTGTHEIPSVIPRSSWRDTLWAQALREKQLILSNEVMDATGTPVKDGSMTRSMTAPVIHQGRAIGLLQVAGKGTPYGDDDQERMRDIAEYVAPTLGARLERDAQARKREEAEESLRHLNQELEDRVASRTAELGAANQELEAFAYSVSHDLRGPLRAIDGFARILEEEHRTQLDEEGRRLLDVVRRNTVQMGKLIDDLLEFSRVGRQSMEKVKVDMEELVRESAERLERKEWTERGVIEIGSLPQARGDRSLLIQVWVNLLSNAMKFSRQEEAPRIRIHGREEDGKVIYTIEDNGVGFDMRYADKLFGVFERLHHPDEFEGTGVGLALCGRIVSRHGGEIRGEGRVDQGATFHFSLPSDGERNS